MYNKKKRTLTPQRWCVWKGNKRARMYIVYVRECVCVLYRINYTLISVDLCACMRVCECYHKNCFLLRKGYQKKQKIVDFARNKIYNIHYWQFKSDCKTENVLIAHAQQIDFHQIGITFFSSIYNGFGFLSSWKIIFIDSQEEKN